MMRKYILEELGTTHFDGEITASVIAETAAKHADASLLVIR